MDKKLSVTLNSVTAHIAVTGVCGDTTPRQEQKTIMYTR